MAFRDLELGAGLFARAVEWRMVIVGNLSEKGHIKGSRWDLHPEWRRVWRYQAGRGRGVGGGLGWSGCPRKGGEGTCVDGEVAAER